MREIKFRQPKNNAENKFVEWFYWGFINDGFICPLQFNVPNYQFTGLRDKHGKEIYEGDICKWKNRIGKKEYQGSIWLIVWSKTYAKFTVEYKGGGKSSDSIFPLFTETDLEIIGNIHSGKQGER